jgi:hypothetical protein
MECGIRKRNIVANHYRVFPSYSTKVVSYLKTIDSNKCGEIIKKLGVLNIIFSRHTEE